MNRNKKPGIVNIPMYWIFDQNIFTSKSIAAVSKAAVNVQMATETIRAASIFPLRLFLLLATTIAKPINILVMIRLMIE